MRPEIRHQMWQFGDLVCVLLFKATKNVNKQQIKSKHDGTAHCSLYSPL